MARKVTPSQLRSMLRQAEQRQKSAVSKYNSAVKKLDRDVKAYNRDVASYNARARNHNNRLKLEIDRLRRVQSPVRYVAVQSSVYTLHNALSGVISATEEGSWSEEGLHLADLAEGETANSAAVANALIRDSELEGESAPDLQTTTIAHELIDLSDELDSRWRGALFSLNPRNPDAARHFCTSSREVLVKMLDVSAPDAVVLAANPSCQRTPGGQPTRREKVQYLLSQKGVEGNDLASFVEADIDDVLSLFRLFNDGTHGSAGTFSLAQLVAIKSRVEGLLSSYIGWYRVDRAIDVATRSVPHLWGGHT